MRKWKDLARPDDPGAWYDVNGFAPTFNGTYESAPAYVNASATATGVGTVSYAFAGKGLSATRQFAIDAAKIWEWNGATTTDRTGGVTVGGTPMMAQYGDVTIGVMGAANATVKSTGGNFSALAGAPNGEIICVHKNAVLIFNTNTSVDGWAASDVGDYTNWATGEAASGRLIDLVGPITAAVPFGDAVYVFKDNAIYRMRYVGGVVKWSFDLVSVGVGCSSSAALNSKHTLVAGLSRILFQGPVLTSSFGGPLVPIYAFDGASTPILVNPETSVSSDCFFSYDPVAGRFCLFNSSGSLYFYNERSDAWGKDSLSVPNVVTPVAPVMGEYVTRTSAERSSWPPWFYGDSGNNLLNRRNVAGGTKPASTVTTSMLGAVDRKTTFKRLIPLLRRWLGNGTLTLTSSFFEELHGSAISTGTATVSSGARKRFDSMGNANLARFQLAFPSSTSTIVEIDDVFVDMAPGGKE